MVLRKAGEESNQLAQLRATARGHRWNVFDGRLEIFARENLGAVGSRLCRHESDGSCATLSSRKSTRAEPQGFPTLMDRATGLPGFHDDGRIRQQCHRPITHWETLRRGLGHRIELRDQQVIAADLCLSSAFSFGYARSSGVPSTAIVRPPAAIAAVCAAVSTPSARPLTTVMS